MSYTVLLMLYANATPMQRQRFMFVGYLAVHGQLFITSNPAVCCGGGLLGRQYQCQFRYYQNFKLTKTKTPSM